jgi:4-aminobutyrate aminotransferase-like enzyme
MGVGGIIPLPEGYMKNIFERVRRYGGLCISD